MLDSKMLDMLRCPVDGGRLFPVSHEDLQRINLAILSGDLRDRLDQRINDGLDAGLLNRQSLRIYPVRGGIPSLVANEAIELPQGFFDWTENKDGRLGDS